MDDTRSTTWMSQFHAGMFVLLAALVSPSHGLLARQVRQRAHTRQTALDDLLLSLLRQEQSNTPPLPTAVWSRRAIRKASALGLVEAADPPHLTDVGRVRASSLLRAHRLWETYLVHEADFAPDHVHRPAHTLEHLPPALTPPPPDAATTTDPQGKPLQP